MPARRRTGRIARLTTVVFYCAFQLAVLGTVASKIDGGWDTEPNTQYHIQTDEGPERYFKYQTISGQYRKERRLQDGSVVGSYGWVDADGYLRLNDYVADSKGYRIVKNKKLYVGTQAPIGQAVSAAKYVPAAAGTAVSASPYRSSATAASSVAAVSVTQRAPQQQQQQQSSWRGSPFVYPSDSDSSPLRFPSSTATPHHRSAATAFAAAHHLQYRRPAASGYDDDDDDAGAGAVRPVDVNSIADDHQPYHRRRSGSSVARPAVVAVTPAQPAAAVRPHTFRPAYRKVVQVHQADDSAAQGSEPAGYDGVSFVRNGFKYYLPRHYHEERSEETAAGGDTRAGSFGYVDPFGIRRVVYYNAAPGTGFVHRKNNRYVGLGAEPYDPRPPQ